MKLKISRIDNVIAFSRCINLIVQYHTAPGDFVSVSSDKDGFDFPLERMDYSRRIYIKSSYFYLPFPRFYVIGHQTDKEMIFLLHNLTRVYPMMFNPWAKFLFVAPNFSPTFAKELFLNNIFNVALLNSRTGDIFSIFPFKEGIYHKPNLTIGKIGNCVESVEFSFHLFQQQLPTIWNTSVSSAMFRNSYLYASQSAEREYSGIEVAILKTFCDHSNFTIAMTMINSNTLQYFGNGHEYDILVGAYAAYNTYYSEITTSYLNFELKWFVPYPEKMPRWSYTFTVFRLEVWIGVIVGVLTLIFAFTMSKMNCENIFTQKFHRAVGIVCNVLFQGRTYKFRSYKYSKEILLFCTIFLSFMLNNLFLSRTTYLLNGINYKKGIESTEDIVANRLYIGVPSNGVKNVLKYIEGLEQYPKSLYLGCYSLEICEKLIMKYRKLALFYPVKEFRYLKRRSNFTKFRMFKELPHTYFSAHGVAYFKRGCALFPLFNKYVGYMIASGIVDSILKVYILSLEAEPELEDIEALTMEHMIAPLSLLGIGIFIGMIVFIWEKERG
ncbi:hypothetical protein WA026_009145 [Henosepilachna vigintioctopunctata]|uniref:Ionotropic receptor n=1 Tax=Henosepilachna vigintioctopunctata TaxID=420089 RepID=A0AAW1UN02_9CUCU